MPGEPYVTHIECSDHRRQIESRLTQGSVEFAKLNVKMNIVLGILAFIGTACGGVIVKILFGG